MADRIFSVIQCARISRNQAVLLVNMKKQISYRLKIESRRKSNASRDILNQKYTTYASGDEAPRESSHSMILRSETWLNLTSETTDENQIHKRKTNNNVQ